MPWGIRTAKTFRPWNLEQTLLVPPSPVQWLPENHLVFFLLDLASELDLSAFYAGYEGREARGVKAYEPRARAQERCRARRRDRRAAA
jgi:hypothetical protein